MIKLIGVDEVIKSEKLRIFRPKTSDNASKIFFRPKEKGSCGCKMASHTVGKPSAVTIRSYMVDDIESFLVGAGFSCLHGERCCGMSECRNGSCVCPSGTVLLDSDVKAEVKIEQKSSLRPFLDTFS
uniref:EB domain-containing protein n=1 Tax=Romanomermis culicivorax TaxID=13658 RepID=A0A915KR90_ROMCU